eukprot:4069746-Pyramimonas_sp.AAC.1
MPREVQWAMTWNARIDTRYRTAAGTTQSYSSTMPLKVLMRVMSSAAALSRNRVWEHSPHARYRGARPPTYINCWGCARVRNSYGPSAKRSLLCMRTSVGGSRMMGSMSPECWQR